MAYSIKAKRQADKDVEEAMDWYEEQRPGLGAEFLFEFLAFCDKISRHPTHFTPKYPPYRRSLMKKFPYAIHFAVNEKAKEVVILAIWHIKRDPEMLKKRLK